MDVTTARVLTTRRVVLLLLGTLVLWTVAANAQSVLLVPAFPVKNTVALVDLGATECIPCKMMAPILRELEREYAGRAAVVFVDVWKNPAPAQRTGIRMIPTQIFYDRTGKEVLRHEGFLDKKSILAVFGRLGVK